MRSDWSREEVEATVADYFSMLAAELSGVAYNKSAHRRRLLQALKERSEQSIEYKHANISAVLIELGFPYISGYKPRSNYQGLLGDIVADRLESDSRLLSVAAADADRPIVAPEVSDILSVLTSPPTGAGLPPLGGGPMRYRARSFMNYLEREARNRSLGLAGETFVVDFERARLEKLRRHGLAKKVEHVSSTRGDGLGFDVLSFEESGDERLIEVKTTKYGRETPFFVSRNEVVVSELRAQDYHIYRLFEFHVDPRLFMLRGAVSETCVLSASSYLACAR